MKKLSKITENLWADLQDRSSGEVERKEDIIRPFDKDELIECIKQQYEKQGKGENLDLTMIDVSNVEDMRGLFECLFSSLNSWDNSQTIKHIDMSNWDVSHVKYMNSMFYGCASIESLEVSDWDVSSVLHMSSMFQNCGNLESIDVSKWKMSSATNLYAMFFRCKKLKTLDVANWDVSHVEVMSEMFSGCKELESLDISNWKPNKLKSAGWMFYNCYKLQPVDVSKWSKSQQDKIPARYRKITENLWADLQDRSSGEVIRKEDGELVHTCLGIDIILQDPQCGYDIFIKDMVKYNSSYCEGISKQAEVGFSTDELVNIRKWGAPYDYLVYDAPYGESLIMSFTTYDDILEYDESFDEGISEKDYIAICKGVAKKFKEVGDSLEYVPNRNSCVATTNSTKRQYAHEYDREYVLMLVDEGTTYYWSADNDREEYVDEFLEEISSEFPELEDEDFILWSYRDGINIGLPHNISVLNNFKKYKEFAQKWFSDENSAKEVSENLWADLQDRSSGEVTRKEDDINLLDPDGMVEYIKDKYDLDESILRFRVNIHIPVFTYNSGKESFLSYTHLRRTLINGELCLFLAFKYFNSVKKKFTPLLDALKEKYDIQKTTQKSSKDWTDLKISPKEGGKITNSFFMDVLDTVVENIEKIPGQNDFIHPLIRKKKLNENLWADLQDRSSGEVIRKEDEIRTNINDIQPVDVGNDIDVFWADRDLELEGETELTIDQVKGFEKDGWRLPTQREADDLLTAAEWVSDKGSKGWSIFYKIGITHMPKVNPKTTVYFDCITPHYAKYWESEEAKNCPDGYWSIFSFKQEGHQENLFPHSAYGICKITDKCRVRLVKSKSKNIKENLWADLQDRSSGEVVRKEDDVNLLDDTAFTEYLKDTYTVNDPITSLEIYIDGAGEITLPVFEYDMGTRSIEFMYYIPKEKKVLIGDWFCHWDDKLMDKIKKTYTTFKYHTSYTDYIRIYPKKGEINNRFFLEVLEFILENANRFYHRLLVKNIKENLWADLQDRSSGEVVRKENIIIVQNKDELEYFIEEKWKEQGRKNLDLTMLDVSLIDDMSGLFMGYNELETLNISNWDVSNVEYMDCMFEYCYNLTSLDLSKWDVSNVEDMQSMFEGCKRLNELKIFDLKGGKVRSMRKMFQRCHALTSLNISDWDVSSVEDMEKMFSECLNLKTLDVSKWNVSNVRYMEDMFAGCDSLNPLDVSNWDKEHQDMIPDKLRKVTESLEDNKLLIERV